MSSHMDKRANNKFPVWLNKQHGEHTKGKATRGHTHDCLGITFGFVDWKVKIDMVECIFE